MLLGGNRVISTIIRNVQMRVSILSVMLVTLCAALTVGTYVADENYILIFCHGAILFIIACTLAIPFVCSKTWLPFWAPYGTATAYALLIQGGDRDYFSQLILLPLYVFGDELTLSKTETPVSTFLVQSAQLWNPVLVGVIAGTTFATVRRLARPRTDSAEHIKG